LARGGEVAAQLDEPGPEVTVQHVEVVDAHAPVGLDEAETGRAGLAGGAVVATEHALELLGHPDGDHPGLGGGLQVGAHHLLLAGVLGEADHGDLVGGGEPLDRSPERVADLGEHRRRGDRVAKVLGEEHHHLPCDLQVGHVGVEVDAVKTLQVQPHMPLEQVVDVDRVAHAAPRTEGGLGPPRGQPDP
jgi:hypothetical protein